MTSGLTNELNSLIAGIKQLAQSGPSDMQFSEAAHKKIIAAIDTYRNELIEIRNNVATNLTNYGNVGGFFSAQETKSQLTDDVTGPDGVLAILDKYIAYLDQFEKTVNAAFSRVQAEDNDS